MRPYTVLVGAMLLAACGDTPVNPLFEVQDVSVNVMEDTPFTVTIPVASSLALTATLTTPPSHGTITSNAAMTSYTYTPAKDYNGPDTLAVTFDNGKETQVGTAHITVTPVDDAPVANPDSFATPFNTPLAILASTLLMNDTDVDSTNLTVTEVDVGDHGSVTMDGTNIHFTPQLGFQGAGTFSYKISDGTLSAISTVTVTVGTNSPPIAHADTAMTAEDMSMVLTDAMLLANDTDADNQTLSITTVSDANHGTITRTPGMILYVPDPNYNGPDVITYTITDGADTSTAAVNITVTPVPDPPTVVDDAVFGMEDQVLSIPASQLLANDSDVDGDTLTIASVGSATNGTVALSGTTVTFTPAPNFNGVAGFTYTVTDEGFNVTGHVTVTLSPVYDPPIAMDDTVTGPEDTTLVVSAATLLANDNDVDGQGLTIVAVSNATHGTVSLSGTTISYVPTHDFFGAATFVYTVTDGVTPINATVHVTITNVNDAPVAAADAITTNEHVAATANVVANDTDVDGDTLTVQSVTQGSNGVVTFSGGTVTYTPTGNFFGADMFTYTESDGNGGTSTAIVTVTVIAVNSGPSAANDTVSTNEDTALTFDPRVNDLDSDGDTLTISGVTQPAHGTATFTGTTITYTPAKDYNGLDAMTYTVMDTHAATSTAIVTITVVPVDDAPIAVNDSYTTNEDTLLTVTAATGVLANDTDIDSTVLNVVLQSPPLHGTLTINADGSFTYLPAKDYNGLDSFTYRASDGALTSTSAAVVSLTINPVNDAPNGVDDSYDININNNLTTSASCAIPLFKSMTSADAPGVGAPGVSISCVVGVLGNDSDVDGPNALTAHLVTAPNHASICGSGVQAPSSTPTPAGCGFTLNPDGSFSYTPVFGFVGVDTFEYVASDGLLNSRVVTVTINVRPIALNDPAGNENYTIEGGDTLCGDPSDDECQEDVLFNDLTDNQSAIQMVLSPACTVAGATTTCDLQFGKLKIKTDGTFTYKAFNYNNCSYNAPQHVETFQYFDLDQGLTSTSPATVTIRIDPFCED